MPISISRTLLILVILSSCSKQEDSIIPAFEVYCEMVANGAKPIALHHPMESKEIDQLWVQLMQVAEKHQVQLFKEDDFPETLLFPFELTKNKSIVIIYRGKRLEQYRQFKEDLKAYTGDEPNQLEGFARRFGRLLGYDPQGINQLLQENTSYRSLSSFVIKQQVTHLYYDNLDEALDFYKNVLGLEQTDSARLKISADAFIELHPVNDEHPKGQPKSTAIALLTDQLPEWYAYIQAKNITVKYPYKQREGGPHDGFVAIDPGGYLLEFEQFKQHPENELFMTVLKKSPKLETGAGQLSFFGSITWTYHKDMLQMQNFYEEALGFELVADQGWTKIYQTSPSGFVGLVDECRGMEDYAESKAVEIEWRISEAKPFNEYAEANWKRFRRDDSTFIGPENYIYRIKQGQ